MKNEQWDLLIERIEASQCTPFLGAAVNDGILMKGAEFAKKWATAFKYPLPDNDDLSKVAQFMHVSRNDGLFPKDQMIQELKMTSQFGPLHWAESRFAVLNGLAEIPFNIYLTTNYDDLMVRALVNRGRRPIREICRWNSRLRKVPSIFQSRLVFEPTPDSPVVFHFHGNDQHRHSLVLTEDDYFDFLVNVSKRTAIIPPRIEEAITASSLLFIGYSLKDVNFRVLFRGLIQNLERSQQVLNVAVQLDMEEVESKNYLERYFQNINTAVYWGTADQFISELLSRWRAKKQGAIV